MADTYDHTRRVPHVGNYNERSRRRDTDRTFPRSNRTIQYVNCGVVGQEGKAKIIGIITMKNQMLLTIMGAIQKAKRY